MENKPAGVEAEMQEGHDLIVLIMKPTNDEKKPLFSQLYLYQFMPCHTLIQYSVEIMRSGLIFPIITVKELEDKTLSKIIFSCITNLSERSPFTLRPTILFID